MGDYGTDDDMGMRGASGINKPTPTKAEINIHKIGTDLVAMKGRTCFTSFWSFSCRFFQCASISPSSSSQGYSCARPPRARRVIGTVGESVMSKT